MNEATGRANVQKAEAEAAAIAAEKEAEAIRTLAEAAMQKGMAEAESRRKMVEAENQLSMKFLLRDVALAAIREAPAVARELMEPARHISEIKVLQTGGMNAANNTGVMGTTSPIMRTLLEAGAAYPMLKELMAFAQSQPETAKIAEKAKELLGGLTGEMAEEIKDVDIVSETKDLPSAAE
jgi:uncharacterized membrane protein YqiK